MDSYNKSCIDFELSITRKLQTEFNEKVKRESYAATTSLISSLDSLVEKCSSEELKKFHGDILCLYQAAGALKGCSQI